MTIPAAEGPDSSPPIRRLTLGLLSSHNPYDRSSFSGTAYFAAKALENNTSIDLKILGPHRPLTLLSRVLKRVLRKENDPIDPLKLSLEGVDAVVGLVASDLLDQLLPQLHVPVFHVTDATPMFLREFYDWDIPQAADATEKRVAEGAASVIYSSHYMAERASEDLGKTISTAVAPFGVNFDDLPRTKPAKAPYSPLNLLFVCSEWKRKGGDIVIAILKWLQDQDIPVNLVVAGHVPQEFQDHPGLTYVGFLNKNTARGMSQLIDLYKTSHIFLLPSRGDCTPMVVAEAMAHGTPVLASDTGGMATLINPGSGQIMPIDASIEDWGKSILDITSDPNRFEKMSDRAFDHATKNLTWDAWAQTVADLCARAVTQGPKSNL